MIIFEGLYQETTITLKTEIMATQSNKKKLPADQAEALLKTLKTRFEKNMRRHKGLDWARVTSCQVMAA